MSSLPDREIYLLIRTDFDDESGWHDLLRDLATASPDGAEPNVDVVDDARYAGLSFVELTLLHPHRASGTDVMYIADGRAIGTADHPLLVVRVGNHQEEPFRCRADVLYEVDANLSLGNLGWDDFRDQVGQSGVYGTPGDEPLDRFPRPPAEFAASGIAATQRIHDALLRGDFAGERSTATAARRMPGTRRTLFRYLANPGGWLTSSGGGEDDRWYRLDAGFHTDPHDYWTQVGRIVPDGCEVECVITDLRSPEYVEAIWTWHRHPYARAMREPGTPYGTPLVPRSPRMTLRFELGKSQPGDEWPMTPVRVVHDQVPVELADDLSAYWRWALERADRDFDLSGARRKAARARRPQPPPAY